MPAVHAICGLPGAGKTAFMSLVMLRRRRREPGRRIVANYPLYLPGRPVEYVDKMSDVFDVTDADVCIDEMHVWMGARNWREHGDEFAVWASQLRKAKVDLWYTTQDMSSVDKFVRVRTLNSYYVTSWRRMGFFIVEEYLGTDKKQGSRCGASMFPVSSVLWTCYDTDHIVRI